MFNTPYQSSLSSQEKMKLNHRMREGEENLKVGEMLETTSLREKTSKGKSFSERKLLIQYH